MVTNKRLYPGVAGKIAKFAETAEDDGGLFIAIRFQDETELSFTLAQRGPSFGHKFLFSQVLRIPIPSKQS